MKTVAKGLQLLAQPPVEHRGLNQPVIEQQLKRKKDNNTGWQDKRRFKKRNCTRMFKKKNDKAIRLDILTIDNKKLNSHLLNGFITSF